MAEAIPEIAETGGEVGVPGMGEAGARFRDSRRTGSYDPVTGREKASRGTLRQAGVNRKSRIPLPSQFGGKPGGSRARAGRAGRAALGTSLPGSHSYQPVILAEFVTAIVVVGVSPLAGGGTATAQAKGSASPYDVNTLKQLVAIGATYFVLALFGASEKMGRYAAWFGALVLVGLGLAQYLNGDLAGVFALLSGQGAPGGSTVAGVQGTAPGVSAPGVNPSGGVFNSSTVDNGTPATQEPTSIFPTLNPGGTITPAG